MIIDVNAHLGPYPFRRLRHHTAAGLLALMDRNGIDRAVVSSLPAAFYRDAHAGNEELAEAVARAPRRLIPLATLNPAYAGWERDLEQAFDEWGMKGVRLLPEYHGYRLDDPHGRAVLAAAARRGLPVALHQRLEDRRQQHAWDRARDLDWEEIAPALGRQADLRVVLLNWLGLSGQAVRDAGLAGRVLIDLTRFPVLLGRDLPRLIETLGIEAVAFGTHMPFNYVGPSLVKLEILELTDAERERVAGRNAVEFLGLSLR